MHGGTTHGRSRGLVRRRVPGGLPRGRGWAGAVQLALRTEDRCGIRLDTRDGPCARRRKGPDRRISPRPGRQRHGKSFFFPMHNCPRRARNAWRICTRRRRPRRQLEGCFGWVCWCALAGRKRLGAALVSARHLGALSFFIASSKGRAGRGRGAPGWSAAGAVRSCTRSTDRCGIRSDTRSHSAS